MPDLKSVKNHRPRIRQWKEMAALPLDLSPDAWELFDVSLTPSTEGIGAYLERVLRHAERVFDANGLSLFLDDGSGEVFRLAARRGASHKIPARAEIRTGKGLAGEAIQRRASALVDSPSTRRNVGSAMVVPLVANDGEVLGVLNLSRRVGGAPFGPEDLRHADAVARQLALAVGNARLYNEARQAEAGLRTLLEAIPTPMFVFNKDGVATDQNESATALVNPPDLTVEGRREHDGRVFWVRSRSIATGGKVVTVDDITDRERAADDEAQLRHLAEVGRMTATIAHEIRNPLTGIRSAAQMMSLAPEHAAEWASIVEQEAARMEELCEQFLNYARPMAVRRTPTDLGPVVSRIVESLRPSFDEAGISLRTEIEIRCPSAADAARIEQVVHNLLRNAFQACAAGDQVVVGAGRNLLWVEDTGRGMTPEELEKAGMPFFTTKTRGTGLGLCTVRKIVDAHGGRLDVESTFGEGTRVTVRLLETSA